MPSSQAIREMHRGTWGVLFEKRLAPGEWLDVHRHERPGFTLTVGGRYVETFEDGAPHEVNRGHVQFKAADLPHTTCAGEAGAWMWIAMPVDAPPGCGGATLSGPGVATARMIALHDAAAAGDTALVEAHAQALVALLATDAARGRRPAGDWLDAVADVQANEIERPHSLAGVAARFGAHPVYLARAFRARFGCSPGAYRHRARVERAVDRIWRGEHALVDLAADLGFADQSHFTRVFRRHAGISPARFRRWADRPQVPIVQDDAGLAS